MEITEHKLGGRILAVYASNSVYAGVNGLLIDVFNEKVLCKHEKSIRWISGDSKYVGCCSYDGKATVIDAVMGNFVDTIEGPETEIKCIAFYDDLIAISTRGKTVWILEDFEISKILEDHLHDVKGCCFYKKRLYSWSYDCTVKMYELFIDENSWELVQSIDVGDIVWNVIFYNERMCVLLQSGEMVVFTMKTGIWIEDIRIKLSVYPIFTGCLARGHLYVVCNRNVLVELDESFNIVNEFDSMCEGFDIMSCCYSENLKSIFLGSDNGILYQLHLKDQNKV